GLYFEANIRSPDVKQKLKIQQRNVAQSGNCNQVMSKQKKHASTLPAKSSTISFSSLQEATQIDESLSLTLKKQYIGFHLQRQQFQQPFITIKTMLTTLRQSLSSRLYYRYAFNELDNQFPILFELTENNNLIKIQIMKVS
ncbi:6510_t:CDS:2, partial [Ambispora gerdemannii]